MFVTSQNFLIYPYKIPTKTPELFQAFIDQEESKYLLEVLGPNLYEAFTDGLVDDWVSTVATVINQEYAYGNDIWKALTVQTGTSPVEGVNWTLVEEDNRWLLLKNGNTYEISDKTYTWGGMAQAFKPLIYSKWVEYGSVNLTDNGFVMPKMENNISINPGPFICRSWNEWSKFIGGVCNPYNSLYGYLYYTNLSSGTFDDTFDETFDTFIDYLNYEFTEQETINILGI